MEYENNRKIALKRNAKTLMVNTQRVVIGNSRYREKSVICCRCCCPPPLLPSIVRERVSRRREIEILKWRDFEKQIPKVLLRRHFCTRHATRTKAEKMFSVVSAARRTAATSCSTSSSFGGHQKQLRRKATTRLQASKFEKISSSSSSSERSSSDDEKQRDDEKDEEENSDKELPNDLFDAVNTAASATSQAISAGQLGIIVELLIPELWDPISGNVMANPGDQLKQWEISRQFAQKLLEERPEGLELTVVFPDAGCAALLKNRWGDELKFKIASANDRMLVPDDYEGVLLFAAADPISLDVVVKSTKKANELQNPVESHCATVLLIL